MATTTKTDTMPQETGALSCEIWPLKKSGPLGLKEEETHTAQGRTSMLLNQHKATPPLLQFAPLQWLHPMHRGKNSLILSSHFILKKPKKPTQPTLHSQ